MQLGHILSGGQFTKEQVMEIFRVAQQTEREFEGNMHWHPLADKKGIGILFDEPSTGTRNCIDSAVHLLGGSVITASYSAETDLSVAKGESFAHTVRRICAQSPSLGALFIRCKDPACLDRAVEEADRYGVKVVNCGNGPIEHPTQALSDLYAILRRRNGNLQDALKFVYAPSVLGSRVFHSHMELFPTCCPCLDITIVAPDDHQIPKADMKKLVRRVTNIDINSLNLVEAVRRAHVLYVIRPQKERYGKPIDVQKLRTQLSPYFLTQRVIDALREDAVVMHALPIDREIQEIPPELENHPKVICFTDQLRSKTIVMMALLSMLLE